MNHTVEHGAAACPLTYNSCNHNVELVFALSLVLDSKKNHNVEHGAVACPHDPEVVVRNVVLYLLSKVIRILRQLVGCQSTTELFGKFGQFFQKT